MWGRGKSIKKGLRFSYVQAGFRPAGRAPFWITRKEPKSDWGLLPVSTLPAAVLTVIAPRPPFYGGRPPGRWALASGGSEHKILHPSCLRDTGPYLVRNLNVSALYGHRLLWQSRGSWSVAGRELSARSLPHQTGRQAPGGVR